MKTNGVMSAFVHFFNDLVGAIVPALVLGTLLAMAHPSVLTHFSMKALESSSLVGAAAIGIAYAIGHVLQAMTGLLLPICVKIKLTKSRTEILTTFRESDGYKLFLAVLERKLSTSSDKKAINELIAGITPEHARSLAMSVSKEAAELGRRFMHISLLYSGIGTALVVVVFECVISFLAYPDSLFHVSHSAYYFLCALVAIVISLLSFYRSGEFHDRALRTPFSVATMDLKIRNLTEKKPRTNTSS